MEGAPLRPVPAQVPGPVDPAEATRHVRETLPGLDEPAAQALALVAIGGRPRTDAASETGMGAQQLSEVLARGRKALRRSLYPLPGSGWCERAERMISDRLDGELRPPGPARLDVHLRNCARCVEHERRLAQATDSLVTAFVEHSAPGEPEPEPVPEPEPEEPAPAPELRVVEPGEEPRAQERQAAEEAPQAPSVLRPAALAWHALFALAVLLAAASATILAVGLADKL